MSVLFLCTLLSGLLALDDGLPTILASKSLEGAGVSVAVADAETGELIFARRIDEPRIPASNLKVLTTAAAVTLLGPDYRFVTALLSAAPPDAAGSVRGDLVVWGTGDPCLRLDAPGVSEDPAALLAGLLREAGVKRIEGALVLDDGFLDREWVHPDWEARDLVHDYAAPVSALSLYGNCVTVSVGGGSGSRPAARLQTDATTYRIDNALSWTDERNVNEVGLLRPDDAGVIRVRGRMSRGLSPRSFTVTVRDGALLFGRSLLDQLERVGIPVAGGLAREAGAARALAEPHELVRLETPLEVAILLANKESDNSISDHLFKVLGTAVDGDGSFAGGGAAVEAFLADLVDTATTGLDLQDGSGLARSNRVTARAMVDTLVFMNRQSGPVRDLFLRSLPVSGRDGTMLERLTQSPYRGAVRAKTGYIREVSSLSGYVRTRTGRTLAFSILINDYPRAYMNKDMKALQDDLCRDLVDRY